MKSDLKAQSALQVHRECQDHKVRRVTWAAQAQRVHKAKLDLKDHKVSWACKVRLDLKVLRGLRDPVLERT